MDAQFPIRVRALRTNPNTNTARNVVFLGVFFLVAVFSFFLTEELFAQGLQRKGTQNNADSGSMHRVARSSHNPIQSVPRGKDGYRCVSKNFIIENAPTPQLAKEFSEAAEKHRRELAVLWFGKEMPNWAAPCPISVRVGDYGATGEMSFIPANGEVYDWSMKVQGTGERIVDSVLPHEISHMIFASAFRQKCPRWIDEGAATSLEHESEKSNYKRMLLKFVDPRVARTIPFNRMVEVEEYPEDFWPLYAQGNSVVEFLIAQRGHRELTRFLGTWFKDKDWNAALRKHYGYENLGDLQLVWVNWIEEGFPEIEDFEPALARIRRVSSESTAAESLAESTAIPTHRDFDSIPVYEPVVLGKQE